jgi:hypothetical protein
MTAPAAQAATTCQLDCIDPVLVQTSTDAIHFAFTTTGAARVSVIVRHGDGTSPHVYTDSGGAWTTTHDLTAPLDAQGAVYQYQILATDFSGYTWQQSGTVSSKVRTSTVKFTKLFVIDSSDYSGWGEINGAARIQACPGAAQGLTPLSMDRLKTLSIQSGTSIGLTASLTCNKVGPGVSVETQLADDDNNGVPYIISFDGWGDGSWIYAGSDVCWDWNSTHTNVADPIPAYAEATSLPIPFHAVSRQFDTGDSSVAALQYTVDGTVTFQVYGVPGWTYPTTGPATLGVNVTPGDKYLTVHWSAFTLKEIPAYGFRVDYRALGSLSWTSSVVGAGTWDFGIYGLANGTTYQVRVARLDGQQLPIGTTEATGVPVGALLPSTITGWPSTSANLAYKSTVSTPVAVTSGGQPRNLLLQYRRSGTATWNWYKVVVSTNAGAATLTYPVLAGINEWRVAAPATSTLAVVISPSRTITSLSTISGYNTASIVAKAGTGFTDGIVVTPGAGRVVMSQYRKSGTSTWITYKTVTASSTGYATLPMLTLKGVYAWRAYTPTTTLHGLAAASPGRWITGT